jgi:6-phospho-beta-glucosidase
MDFVTEEELQILKEAAPLCDFIGINYYQSGQVAANPREDNFTGGSKMNNDGSKGSAKD